MENIILNIFKEKRNSVRKSRLKNKSFTIISSECAGGVIYHDLGLRFD